MFEDSTIFAMIDVGKSAETVLRLEVDASTQRTINEIFDKPVEGLLGKEPVKFFGEYTPAEDEVLMIEDFVLSDQLMEALRNPMSIDSLILSEEKEPKIKALCVGYFDDRGNSYKAAFQRFRKNQYISQSALRLLFDKNTFKEDKRKGLAISESVDCIYINGTLFFTSYYFAKQIFDLSQYYRDATDSEVKRFIDSPIFDFDGSEEFFFENAKPRVRRRIASILDSGVIDSYNAKEIKNIAKKYVNMEITIKNNRIQFPREKKDVNLLLCFLDEEAWKGCFSGDVFMANGKRKA